MSTWSKPAFKATETRTMMMMMEPAQGLPDS